MRLKNKYYWRIPGGEIQYGRLSHTITIWFRRRAYHVKVWK